MTDGPPSSGTLEPASSNTSPAQVAREVEMRLQEILARLKQADAMEAELAGREPTGQATEPAPEPRVSEHIEDQGLGGVDGVTATNEDRTRHWERRSDANGPVPRLGEMLIGEGLLTREELDQGLQLQRTSGRRLGETLVDMGLVTSLDLTRVLANHLGVPFVDLDEHPPDVLVRDILTGDAARRYRAIPVERWRDQLIVAMVDPKDVFALDDIRVLTGERILPVLADATQVESTIDRVFHASGIASSLDDVDEMSAHEEAPDVSVDATDAPIVNLANALLEQAIVDHASDIHIEPVEGGVRIRMRIDGMLHVTSEAPLSVLRPLVARLKVMGGLDIAQARLPQDGRFSLAMEGRSVDVRIATIPAAGGEAAVLRMLDKARAVVDLGSLGLTQAEQARLLPHFQASQGAIIVTGPTGSGKSSTLYAALSEMNRPETSIVSVEDPIEYRLSGVKQIQIHTRAGMTFPSALRSILRADPDVILIGEVRDAETARIAADASITGHLVLSSLHATRAAAGPIRLIDMGVEPYLVSSALTCVAAQRLHRCMCDACAHDVGNPDLDVLRAFGATDAMLDAGIRVRAATGCPQCLSTGYRGRSALVEIMTVSDTIGRMIVERASATDVERVAVEEGMDTLRVAAVKRVLSGDLTVEEMIRIVG
jgi:type IV pilus assembly protein PilB